MRFFPHAEGDPGSFFYDTKNGIGLPGVDEHAMGMPDYDKVMRGIHDLRLNEAHAKLPKFSQDLPEVSFEWNSKTRQWHPVQQWGKETDYGLDYGVDRFDPAPAESLAGLEKARWELTSDEMKESLEAFNEKRVGGGFDDVAYWPDESPFFHPQDWMGRSQYAGRSPTSVISAMQDRFRQLLTDRYYRDVPDEVLGKDPQLREKINVQREIARDADRMNGKFRDSECRGPDCATEGTRQGREDEAYGPGRHKPKGNPPLEGYPPSLEADRPRSADRKDMWMGRIKKSLLEPQ